MRYICKLTFSRLTLCNSVPINKNKCKLLTSIAKFYQNHDAEKDIQLSLPAYYSLINQNIIQKKAYTLILNQNALYWCIAGNCILHIVSSTLYNLYCIIIELIKSMSIKMCIRKKSQIFINILLYPQNKDTVLFSNAFDFFLLVSYIFNSYFLYKFIL